MKPRVFADRGGSMRSMASRTRLGTYCYWRAGSITSKVQCRTGMFQASPRMLKWLFDKHGGTLACWVDFALGRPCYLLNLSWELPLNLPRFKNKTCNFLVGFSFSYGCRCSCSFPIVNETGVVKIELLAHLFGFFSLQPQGKKKVWVESVLSCQLRSSMVCAA